MSCCHQQCWQWLPEAPEAGQAVPYLHAWSAILGRQATVAWSRTRTAALGALQLQRLAKGYQGRRQ